MTKYDDKTMMVYLDYYSYDNNGDKTISIHYCDQDYCKDHPYGILGNGGVALMWMTEDDLAQAARLCLQNRIIIDSIHEH